MSGDGHEALSRISLADTAEEEDRETVRASLAELRNGIAKGYRQGATVSPLRWKLRLGACECLGSSRV